MSQAQDAMLGNLPNGIVTTLASHYVTNVMNADPETKLRYGQNAPLGSRPSRLVTCFVYLTLTMDHSRVSFLYAPVDDKPKNSVETVQTVMSQNICCATFPVKSAAPSKRRALDLAEIEIEKRRPHERS